MQAKGGVVDEGCERQIGKDLNDFGPNVMISIFA